MSIGRNDPCPCGSGKKYKKCCYMRDTDGAQSPSTKPKIHEVHDLYIRRNQWLIDELSKRTPAEVLYDEAVIDSLNKRGSIKEALSVANRSYPEEAMKYNDSNIDDIEDHYRYLLNHLDIMKKFEAVNEQMDRLL